MSEKIYGYIRVSSKEQNIDRQLFALDEFGVAHKNIFIDKQSGKNFERPAYKKLIKRLKANDTLVIKSIDRLGRNYDELLEQWNIITKQKKVYIVVLDCPLLNTTQYKDSIHKLIADIFLQVISYFAETERNFIHQRQAEGIIAAKKRGVKFGRRPLKPPDSFKKIYIEWLNGNISARKAAKILNVSHHTFIKWAKNPT